MAERIRRDGLASIIKYEGDRDTLIWKHPIEDFNLGSQLIVHESQEAIFFKDGQALDLFGPGRYTLVPIAFAFTGAFSTPPDADTCAPIYFIMLFMFYCLFTFCFASCKMKFFCRLFLCNYKIDQVGTRT